jgi:hypothetical protein
VNILFKLCFAQISLAKTIKNWYSSVKQFSYNLCNLESVIPKDQKT